MNKLLPYIIASTFLLTVGRGAAENAREVQQEYPSAPEFILPDLSGKNHKLSEFKGRVVLLDFWATWCGPCRMSTPALVELGKKMKGKKFSVIGISIDDTLDGVKDFADSMGVEHLILYGGGSTINETYQVRAIPAFYLIDKKGKVRKHYPGYAPRMPERWEKDILTLLAEKN